MFNTNDQNPENPLDIIRNIRDQLLAECDWMSNSDYVMPDEWKIYRQKLRDITKTTNVSYKSGTRTLEKNEDDSVKGVEWPRPPDERLRKSAYPLHYDHIAYTTD